MTDNVKCAGQVVAWSGSSRRPDEIRELRRPCGWKGERFAVGKRVGVSYLHWDDEDRKARTRKPCPRCGGRVELIGEAP
jgi:hypothetical protein